jgi:beta-galactosidase
VFLVAALSVVPCRSAPAEGQPFVPPPSPRRTFSMNPDWKFIKRDVAGAEAPGFDDAGWTTVSTPHTFNDADTFNEIITSHGQRDEYMGVAWYRKHFKLPADLAGCKVFLEFEGMRQAGRFFLNGKALGLYENGVTPCGLDVTDAVRFGDEGNVLAVKIDNSHDYKEQSSGVGFQWESRDFNPNFGGINRNVWLHVAGKVYQTLPLYENLRTTGVYLYPTHLSVPDRTADVTVEAQVRNESDRRQAVALSAVVVSAEGRACANLKGDSTDLAAGETRVLTAAGRLGSARFWDDHNPYLYDVYSILTINGQAADVCRVRTGFRKTAFRGGAGTGGVYLNDRSVYLKGYAQRSTDEWAGLGQAYPDWMHDFTADLVRGSHANYVRWMHVSPMRADVSACDRYGVVEICPAGDKEGDAEGRQWEQRVEVMRASMIYFRNHPSILFWEAGNNGISGEHMKQMRELKEKWDPHGGRAIGCRSIKDPAAVPVAEYFGVMVGQDPRTDALRGPTDTFRGYSAERRDRAPLVECEDFRDEAARRFWDDFSPPRFGFKKKPQDTYDLNSETFCVAAVRRYHDYWSQRIANTDPRHSKWSGYASIIFADTISHGRQYGSEVCRVSGKVDAVRLPKQAYFTYRVIQNERPDIHVVGHWTYPAGTKKTVYVVCNCQAVELFVNGRSVGKSAQPRDGFLFPFPDVEWQPGTIKAVGLNDGKVVCRHELETAGQPKRIKLTAITGPEGLQADGSDVALIDVEVMDDLDRRCPTDEGRVDFAVEGPAVWRGGYNSGKVGSTNNLYLDTECGINRAAVRSTLKPGVITLTATRKGLEPGKVEIEARPAAIVGGLTPDRPQRLKGPDVSSSPP